MPAGLRCACAAALLALGCRPPVPAPPPAATVDLLARFHDVDCRSDALDLPFLLSRTLLAHRGWETAGEAARGKVAVWLAGTEATLELPFETTGPKSLRLTARCKAGQRPQLPVTVLLNGRELATLAVTPEESDRPIAIPEDAQVRGPNELRLVARPRAERRRPLLITGLEIGPGTAVGGSPPDPSGDGLRLPSGSSVRYALDRSRPMALDILVEGGAAKDGAVAVALEEAGGHRELAVVRAAGGGSARVAVPPGPVARVAIQARGAVRIRTLRLGFASPSASKASPTNAPVAARRPNLVLYIADAVRADFLSAYGYPRPTSPRFDAFAAAGGLFTDATAQSSWTRPSVASLLTGLGVDAHGVFGTRNAVVDGVVTLAESLQAAGYATAAFVANDVVTPTLGYAQGFATWIPLPRRPSDEVARAALDWVRGRREPFFLYVHTLGAHRPYLPSPEHWQPFLPPGRSRPPDVNALVLRPRLAPGEMDVVRSAYAAEVHESDAAFGGLLDGLQTEGLLERTAVAFTADHGEAFDEHGDRGHGASLYQETVRVPLALRVPGLAGGVRTAVPAQHADLAPTFLALAGVPRPPELRGLDLRDLAGSGRDPHRVLIGRLTYAGADKIAVRRGSLKLVVNEEPRAPPGRRFELYDLGLDPGEARDLAAGRREEVEHLWMESRAARRIEEAFRARIGAGRAVAVSPEDREALRALGYVE